MKNSFIVFLSLILLFLTHWVPLVKSQTAQKSFRLGFVKSSDGVSELIWLSNTKNKDRVSGKSVAILDTTGWGIININGHDIEIKRIKDNLSDKNFKVGRGGYQIWKGKKTTVRLDYIFTWLCPPKDEQCEVYYYKGILDINYKGKQRKVNITGFGGS